MPDVDDVVAEECTGTVEVEEASVRDVRVRILEHRYSSSDVTRRKGRGDRERGSAMLGTGRAEARLHGGHRGAGGEGRPKYGDAEVRRLSRTCDEGENDCEKRGREDSGCEGAPALAQAAVKTRAKEDSPDDNAGWDKERKGPKEDVLRLGEAAADGEDDQRKEDGGHEGQTRSKRSEHKEWGDAAAHEGGSGLTSGISGERSESAACRG